jgi:hypothetical protein
MNGSGWSESYLQWRHDLAFVSHEKTQHNFVRRPADDDGPPGHGIVGNRLSSHGPHGEGHLLGRGIPPNGHRENDGHAAFNAGADDRAQPGSGYCALPDPRTVQRKAVALKNLVCFRGGAKRAPQY